MSAFDEGWEILRARKRAQRPRNSQRRPLASLLCPPMRIPAAEGNPPSLLDRFFSLSVSRHIFAPSSTFFSLEFRADTNWTGINLRGLPSRIDFLWVKEKKKKRKRRNKTRVDLIFRESRSSGRSRNSRKIASSMYIYIYIKFSLLRYSRPIDREINR